jgi:hypothetical protein
MQCDIWRAIMTKNDQNIAKWVDTWKQAAPALHAIRKKELSNFEYSSNYKLIDDMLQYACEHAVERTTTGLIEQQRLFKKYALKMGMIK